MGALTVLFVYFAVRLVTADPWTPVVGAAIVAFLPRFVFLSSFITNDNLVNLLGAILTVVTLRYALQPSRWRMAAVGVVVGLLMITKLSALPMALVLVVLALMAAGWKGRAESLGIGVAATLAISGWYFIQNTVRYGDPLARAASARYLSQVGGLGVWIGATYKIGNPVNLVLGRVPDRLLNSFWYQSGWNQFSWPWPVNLLFSLVLAAAVAGLIHRHLNRNVLLVLVMVAVTGLFRSGWLPPRQRRMRLAMRSSA